MYCHCSANVCCGAKIVHADESSGPERAATISSVSWLFLVVIPEYRGLSDSVARWIFRLRRFHALARRSGSVFREQQLLLSKNHETHCCSRLPVQNLRSGARKPLGDAPSIATKMVGRIGEWSGSRLETTVAAIAQSRFRTAVDRTAAGHRIRRNPNAASAASITRRLTGQFGVQQRSRA